MKIRVSRDVYTSLSTCGKLFLDDQHFCFTLEPPVRDDGSKPRAIPVGTYPLSIRWSAEFGKHVPHVENVPGFAAIEQHWGNFPKDTLACTLVGLTRGPQPNFVGQSVVAWTHLMSRYMDVAKLTNPLEYSEKSHIWMVGEVTYEDLKVWPHPDVDGEISV